MPRTLVVHTGAIGDFLLALPAIAILRADGPIELAGYSDRLDLAVAGDIADAAHSLDAIDFQSALHEPSPRLREFAARFDRAIVWMRDPDRTISRNLGACGIRRVDTFPGLPDVGWTRHARDYYARCLGVAPQVDFRLRIASQGRALDVVIHPGSGSVEKNWPLENYIELAERLHAHGRTVTWCLGPAESDRQFHRLNAVSEILRCELLAVVAGRLAAARLFIGNDSGITHLSALLGVSTIALFSRTDPAVWAPLGKHVRLVQGAPWPDVATVLALAERS
jgi:ADP-heptose:LPS heptosyltransferase